MIAFGYLAMICSPLFASARKAVFPAPTATGVHRLRNTWSSLPSQRLVGGVVWGRSNLPQKRSTVLSESKFGAPKSKIPESAPEFPPRQRSSATYRLAASKLFILAARELYARGEALPLAWCSLANGSSNYRKAFPGYRRFFFSCTECFGLSAGGRGMFGQGRTNEPIRNKEYLGTCFNFFCVCEYCI